MCNMAWTFDFAGEILWSGGRSRGRPNPAYIVYNVDNMMRPAGWRKKGDCPPPYHMVLMSAAPISTFPPWAGGGGGGLLGLIFAEYVPLAS